jgi:hypothetical protein
LTVRLDERALRWADLHLSASGYGHDVDRYSDAVGRAGEDLELAYGSGRRPTMLDVGAVHALARADAVWLRLREDGAREVPAATGESSAYETVLEMAREQRSGEDFPPLRGRRAFVLAADRLPEEVDEAAEGSVLMSATAGDPRDNADPADLITDL